LVLLLLLLDAAGEGFGGSAEADESRQTESTRKHPLDRRAAPVVNEAHRFPR